MSGWLGRLRKGLTQTSNALSDGLISVFSSPRIDQKTIENLEDLLITADIGPTTSARLAATLSNQKFEKNGDPETTAKQATEALADEITNILEPVAKPLVIDTAARPHVLLIVGVNGTGKTTTIGKLAHYFVDEGHSVMLAAADTFRAAAVEQLRVWSERAGALFFNDPGTRDPAAVAFGALEAAKKEGVDILIIDTAGRLHNKSDQMAELEKITRVIKKLDDTAPHSTVLVLDATTGQNAHIQAETFRDITKVDGLIVTKLDGTARGGVLVALADRLALPIHAIGVGEGLEDLRPFAARDFARSLLGLDLS